MDRTDVRLLEEWKANNELFKIHEDLKQRRLNYFLAIQTVFFSIFGFLIKEATIELSVSIIAGILVLSTPPLIISLYFMRLDSRARAFIDTVKGKILLIEKDWQQNTLTIISQHIPNNFKF